MIRGSLYIRGLLYISDGGSEERGGEGSEGIKGAISGAVKLGLW